MGQRDEARRRGRSAILEAALTEFLQHGLHGASTRGIAARAGVSQATLFHHFTSKQTLHDALIEIGIDHITLDDQAALIEPLGALDKIVHNTLGMLRDHPDAARMFLFMSRAGLGESGAASEAARATLATTARVIEAAQARGRVRAGDARALSVALWGALQGVADVVASDPSLPIPEESWILAMLVP